MVALAADHVIHAVGPRWSGGAADEATRLADCYRALIREAQELHVTSVAIPAISTGICGYPLPAACEVAPTTLAAIPTDSGLQDVYLVAFDRRTAKALRSALSDFARGQRAGDGTAS